MNIYQTDYHFRHGAHPNRLLFYPRRFPCFWCMPTLPACVLTDACKTIPQQDLVACKRNIKILMTFKSMHALVKLQAHAARQSDMWSFIWKRHCKHHALIRIVLCFCTFFINHDDNVPFCTIQRSYCTGQTKKLGHLSLFIWWIHFIPCMKVRSN